MLFFSCCVTNCPKFSGLRLAHSFVYLVWHVFLGCHKAEIKVVGWIELLSGGSVGKSISRLLLVGGRIQFFEVVGLESPFLCWLSTGNCSQLLGPYSSPQSFLVTEKLGLSPSHNLILCDFLFTNQLKKTLLLKGYCDYVRTTWLISLF